jgi:hypothetical protein
VIGQIKEPNTIRSCVIKAKWDNVILSPYMAYMPHIRYLISFELFYSRPLNLHLLCA